VHIHHIFAVEALTMKVQDSGDGARSSMRMRSSRRMRRQVCNEVEKAREAM